MMLVFNEQRSMPVLKYSDLTQRFVEYNEAKRKQWERLQYAALGLAHELEASLEFPSPRWSDIDRQEYRYVQTGVMNGNRFEPQSINILPDQGFELDFAIKLTLEEGPNILPKSHVAIGIKLREVESTLEVTIKGQQDTILRVTRKPEEGRFADAVEVIKRMVIDALNMDLVR